MVFHVISVGNGSLDSLGGVAGDTGDLLGYLRSRPSSSLFWPSGLLGRGGGLGDDRLGLGDTIDPNQLGFKDLRQRTVSDTPATSERGGHTGHRTQGRPGRDGAHGSLAVAKLWRDGEGALLSDAHVKKTFVPADPLLASTSQHGNRRGGAGRNKPFDDLSATKLEAKRGVAVVTWQSRY